MKKIGLLLKTEREKKNLSLHEIGMALKINPKILKAIEEADTKNLPAKTFLRGFIRSYAQYLRMDVDQIMAVFHEEVGSTRPEEPKSQQSLPTDISPKIVSTDKPATEEKPKPAPATAKTEKTSIPKQGEGLSSQKIYTLIGSLALILMIVFVARMVDKYQKESRRVKIETSSPIALDEKESPEKPVDLSTPLTSADTAVLPMTPISGETLEEKKQSTAAASPSPHLPSPSPVVIHTPAPTPTPVPVASRTPTPIAKPSPAPTVASTPAASPTPTPSPVALKATEVIVEALNRVEIKYSFGDDKWETLTLAADELHTFKSKTGVFLEITDGGAVNLIVNGRDRGVPGSMGKPIKLSYPK